MTAFLLFLQPYQSLLSKIVEQFCLQDEFRHKLAHWLLKSYFVFITFMPQRHHVEQMRKLISTLDQFLTVTSVLQVFCFARHVVYSECCLRLTNLRYGTAWTIDEHNWLIFNRINFGHSCNKRLNLGCRSSLRR